VKQSFVENSMLLQLLNKWFVILFQTQLFDDQDGFMFP